MRDRGDGYIIIRLEDIETGDNVRSVMDQGKLGELVESIKTVGLLEPVGVYRLPEGGYHLVFGHRRMAAYRILLDQGLVSFGAIKSVVLRRDDDVDDVTPLIQLIENMHREDLSPADMAKGIVAVRAQLGYTQKQFASLIGKKPSWISVAESAHKIRIYAESLGYQIDPQCQVFALQWFAKMDGAELNEALRQFADCEKHTLPEAKRIVAEVMGSSNTPPPPEGWVPVLPPQVGEFVDIPPESDAGDDPRCPAEGDTPPERPRWIPPPQVGGFAPVMMIPELGVEHRIDGGGVVQVRGGDLVAWIHSQPDCDTVQQLTGLTLRIV